MPYREVPQAAVTHQPDDPASVKGAIELRDRFGRLEASKLWPPPADAPFSAYYTRGLAVSGDGKRALVFADSYGWLLDTATMVAAGPVSLPDDASIAVLDRTGKTALFIAGSTLYRWEVDASAPDFRVVWQSDELARANSLRMTPDARVAIATARSSRATIRVFDLQAMTMTYSFEADADESLILHPEGRHIVCFGDDTTARVFSRDGHTSSIEECTGGAFSPDGTRLLTNSYRERHQVHLYDVHLNGQMMSLGQPRQYLVRPRLKTWDWRARFSPSGERVLLEAVDNELVVLDFHKNSNTTVNLKLNWATAFAADEATILSPRISAREFGVHSEGIAIAQAADQEIQGILCATRSKPPVLAAITPLGLYGSIENEARPTKQEIVLPYERPEIMSRMLSRTGSPLERSEQRRLDEVSARREAWRPFYNLLTDDIGDRELMAVNRGLVELTPEIVVRAMKAMENSPRFGRPQLGLAALQSAGEELRAMGSASRQPVFEKMIRRMRGPGSTKATGKKRSASESDDSDEWSQLRSKLVEGRLASDQPPSPPSPLSKPAPSALAKAMVTPADEEDEEHALVVAADTAVSRLSPGAWLGLGVINIALWSGVAYLLLT